MLVPIVFLSSFITYCLGALSNSNPAATILGQNATPAQVALAWLLAKGDDIAAIPGGVAFHRRDIADADFALMDYSTSNMYMWTTWVYQMSPTPSGPSTARPATAHRASNAPTPTEMGEW